MEPQLGLRPAQKPVLFNFFIFLFYRLNFHGDELHPLGGAELGAELGAQVSYMAELGGLLGNKEHMRATCLLGSIKGHREATGRSSHRSLGDQEVQVS